MKDNNQKLSEQIYEIEDADWKQKTEWYRTRWEIGNGDITLEKSDDLLVWYLWKEFPDQSRLFYKVVPRGLGQSACKESIEKVLDAQPWMCV